MGKKHKIDKQTTITQPDFKHESFKSLTTPTVQGSTVVFDTVSQMRNRNWRDKSQYTYGLLGTPTTRKLEQQLAKIDDVQHCVLAPSGLAAITLVMMSVLNSGDMVYLPHNVYVPALEAAKWLQRHYGIIVKRYDPLAVDSLKLEPACKLLWVETPGSVTMEVADLPKLSALAHSRGAVVAVDATWAAGLALPVFKLGADLSIQALTKYQSGGSDVMMGAVTTDKDTLYEQIKETMVWFGNGVSPQDCQTILRSLPHMSLRYQAQDTVAREAALWCAGQPAIEAVLHPALKDAPGHAVWQRDFTGAASLFSIVFDSTVPQSEIDTAVEALQYFHIGFSWGGAVSLAVPFKAEEMHEGYQYKGGLVRLYIGLEAKEDLIEDLAQALVPLNRFVTTD